jgi:hypothetical protein
MKNQTIENQVRVLLAKKLNDVGMEYCAGMLSSLPPYDEASKHAYVSALAKLENVLESGDLNRKEKSALNDIRDALVNLRE